MKETITGQKAEYRSAIRTRRMIWDAYTQLLKEKGLSRIPVTDIVTRADLNRATFYAHYPDVRDVTEKIENELIAKMLEVLEEFRYTQLFPQSGPAAEAQPLSGGGRGLLPPTGARQRLRALHGKAEKGVNRPYAA